LTQGNTASAHSREISPPELIDAELSLLAFQRRVLALAEDPAVPLLERMRFLGIVTSNLDELYMIRMVELRRDAVDEPSALSSAKSRLRAVEAEIAEILAAQAHCAEQCVREAAARGTHIVAWNALTHGEREQLQHRYEDEIHRDLVSHAITMSPGFPLPHLPHLGLFVAVVFRAAPGERARLAEHELPRDVPRLLEIPGRRGSVIAIEEVLRANAHTLYPDAHVEGAYLFRVTRGGDLTLSEDDANDLLDAVADATARRPHNPAVRVEVERSMPAHVGELILDMLRREAIGRDMELTVTSVQVVDGLLDLRCLASLPLEDASHCVPPDLVRAPTPVQYAPLAARDPFAGAPSVFTLLGAQDMLLHHPFDAFEESVVRFFREAAADDDVIAIHATLYRVGNPSPIVEALLSAARQGKQVFVLVELQARFDEEHNVHWGRALERAGGQVVYGLPGLKVHAKAALVTRNEGDRLRYYGHIGTGNYNTRSGRQYTDLSLFTTRDELTGDLRALFEALANRSSLPEGLPFGGLVAPHQLLPALLRLIEREVQHAQSGGPASITIKVNGLADTEVVRALARASQAGVQVDLVVRGICTLRPGVPVRSAGIRVVSIVGRFLEHSRIYRFGNGGAPEYLIGSADLRPRNLRRRLELLVPVVDSAQQARLDQILERYLHDDTAWQLTSEGKYTRRAGDGGGAQAVFVSDAPSREYR
jgi:polyphosphate kinase